jgi:putative heme iron utilization protein
MDATLSTDQAAAICAHMNDDHADAIAAYARVYGQVADVRSAAMIRIDTQAMELDVVSATGPIAVRIPFDHELRDSTDARETLIAMARHAATSA